jgi:hypothetical protein
MTVTGYGPRYGTPRRLIQPTRLLHLRLPAYTAYTAYTAYRQPAWPIQPCLCRNDADGAESH